MNRGCQQLHNTGHWPKEARHEDRGRRPHQTLRAARIGEVAFLSAGCREESEDQQEEERGEDKVCEQERASLKEAPCISPLIIPLILGLGVPSEGVQESRFSLLGVLDAFPDSLREGRGEILPRGLGLPTLHRLSANVLARFGGASAR